MAVHTSGATQAPAGYEGYVDEDRGYGWVTFAGVLLIIVGTLNTIEGIAAASPMPPTAADECVSWKTWSATANVVIWPPMDDTA